MKYNIIGDIHGRTCWKKLVLSDAVNIFVGDYFSPYHIDITWEQQKQNFLEIINYKIVHPETVLLIGNHDEDHWHWVHTGCSRHDYEHAGEIKELFEQNKQLFQAAYSIENKALVTHAGLSILWLFYNEHCKENTTCAYNSTDLNAPICFMCENIEEAYAKYNDYLKEAFKEIQINDLKKWDLFLWKNKWYYWDNGFHTFDITPDAAAEYINNIWHNNPHAFAFRVNADYNDDYGTTPRHSPMWIRIGDDAWSGLTYANIFKGTEYIQIFGHTLSDNIEDYYDALYDGDYWYDGTTGHMIMVDCLEYKNKSYVFLT